MIGAPTVPLSTLAFGDQEADLWGVVWGAGDAVAIIGGSRTGASVPIDSAAQEASAVQADGLALEVEVIGECEISYQDESDSDADASDAEVVAAQICRITGTASLDGEPQTVDCLGLRVTHAAPDPAGLDSLRQVLAWFAPDDAVAVAAARPRRSAGHDRDDVVAVTFEPAGPLGIDEARLSTTYGEDGAPRRMSLELWPVEEEDQEVGYPRRVAGEVIGPVIVATAGEFRLEARPMRCHRAGQDGPGVYLIARPTSAHAG
ncbi:MAG: hypothetical protein ACYDHH_32665 [Solirubrobacteraceae bacterium]